MGKNKVFTIQRPCYLLYILIANVRIEKGMYRRKITYLKKVTGTVYISNL